MLNFSIAESPVAYQANERPEEYSFSARNCSRQSKRSSCGDILAFVMEEKDRCLNVPAC